MLAGSVVSLDGERFEAKVRSAGVVYDLNADLNIDSGTGLVSGRLDAECRRDRRPTLGVRRLRRSLIEITRRDDVDCCRITHGVPDQFGSVTLKLSSG